MAEAAKNFACKTIIESPSQPAYNKKSLEERALVSRAANRFRDFIKENNAIEELDTIVHFLRKALISVNDLVLDGAKNIPIWR